MRWYIIPLAAAMLAGLPVRAESPLDKLCRERIPDRVADQLPPEVVTVVGGPRPFGKAFALSSDASTLATAANDGTLQLWHLDGSHAEEIALLKTAVVTAVAFAPDGRTLTVADLYKKQLTLWDISGKAPKWAADPAPLDVHVGEIRFAPDGKSLVTVALRYENVCLWDIERSVLRLRKTLANEGYFFTAAFSPDGRTLATASSGAKIHLRDASTGEEKATILCNAAKAISALAFSMDGRMLAAEGKDFVTLWEVATCQLRAELPWLRGRLDGGEFSTTNRLVTVCTQPWFDELDRQEISHEVSYLKVGTATGELVLECRLEGRIHAATWADDRHLVVHHKSGLVYVVRIPR